MGIFLAEATAKLKFYRSSSGTDTLTLNGINSSLSSVETVGDGVSSLTAIGGYSSPNMNGAVRTIEEVATNGNDG